MRADAERLSRLISHEEGKPLRESGVEIEGWTAGFFEYFATFVWAVHGEILPSDNRGEEIAIRKVPYGVCVGVTPWNFPSAVVTRKVAPALMARQHDRGEAEFDDASLGAGPRRDFRPSRTSPGVVSVLTGARGTIGDALVVTPSPNL